MWVPFFLVDIDRFGPRRKPPPEVFFSFGRAAVYKNRQFATAVWPTDTALRCALQGRDCIMSKFFKQVPAGAMKLDGSSSNKSSSHTSLDECSNATSRRSLFPFLPPSTSYHSVDMSDPFSNWQYRFHHGQQNVVPDSIPRHETGNADGADFNLQGHVSNAEFQRLMNERIPSQGNGGAHFSLPNSYSQQTESQFQDSKFQNGSWQQSPPPPPPAGDPQLKKRSSKIPARKAKKGKTTVVLSDDEDGEDGNQVQRWTDPEVSQLIAFRSEMDDNFKTNAKKQGINTWEKLQCRMVAACDNFSKSVEACRKKWKVIYNQYCNDKRLLQISGEGRKVLCKFFDEIDEGFNNAANVRKFCHGDARGNPNPCPPDLNDQWEPADSAQATKGGEAACTSKELSPAGSKGPKKSTSEHIASFMSAMVIHTADMVDCSRDMVTHTARIADDIHSNGLVLKELQVHMAKLIDKL